MKETRAHTPSNARLTKLSMAGRPKAVDRPISVAKQRQEDGEEHGGRSEQNSRKRDRSVEKKSDARGTPKSSTRKQEAAASPVRSKSKAETPKRKKHSVVMSSASPQTKPSSAANRKRAQSVPPKERPAAKKAAVASSSSRSKTPSRAQSRGRGRARKEKVQGEKPVAVPKKEAEVGVIAAETKPKEKNKESEPKVKPRSETVEWHWTGWKNVFFCGTEWENYDLIFAYQWNFDHLFESLAQWEEENPMSESDNRKWYLFGQTEPQYTQTSENSTSMTVVVIPTIIAVLSERPPPRLLGIKSVQMTEERIVSFDEMKMDWIRVEQSPRIFIQKCTVRRESLKRMPLDKRNDYVYCMPYLLRQRDLRAAEDTQDTCASVQYERKVAGQAPVMFDFDWELDTLSDRLEEIYEEYDVADAEEKEAIKEATKQAVRSKKASLAQEKEALSTRYNSFDQSDREAWESMRIVKYYPNNEQPNVAPFKNSYVNRYYGKADEVV